MENKMFCYQCQETAQNVGCKITGVCGKNPQVSALQDLLIYATKGLSEVATRLRKEGNVVPASVNRLVTLNMFVTITNANFDSEDILNRINETAKAKSALVSQLKNRTGFSSAVSFEGGALADCLAHSKEAGVLATENEDVRSLHSLIVLGIKGMSAYSKHANVLGYEDEKIDAFLQEALAKTLDPSLSVDELVNLTLETGKFGVDVMALLDKANTKTYGNPEITKVNIGVAKNPGILVSGHDLFDLEMLLKQTEGCGIDIYTHSEMLPANYYPELKKYKHLVGNYGNAWWQQTTEFESFNGPVLMTTNCLVPPKPSYKDRVFTTNAVGFPGLKYIKTNEKGEKDFSEMINLAKTCPPPTEIEKGEIIGGFAHNQVFALADKIVEAVKSGALKKFVVMSGCDGRQKGRSYYTDFANALPKDTVILTSGCAKYRYNKLNLGDINGIPRVLDAGQCNDSYSLAVVALKLKEIFELSDINELPIAFNIAWYEQKAIIVLLALLYLGVKNIHVGPTLPAFLSPAVAKVLIEKFNLGGISSVEEDIALLIA